MRTRHIGATVGIALGATALVALGMNGTALAAGTGTGDHHHGSNGGNAGDNWWDEDPWGNDHGGHRGHGHHGRDDRDGRNGRDGRDGRNAAAHWGLIERNIIGAGMASLRSGPYENAFGNNLKPPSGTGSLHVQTPTGNDKVDFGNEVDFVNKPLSGLNQVAYDVYTTTENVTAGGAGNLPGIRIEVDPDGPGPLTFSTLVFVPNGTGVTPGTFSHIDATNPAAGSWFFTQAFGTTAPVCSLASPCTFAAAKAKAAAATMQTVAIGKGRDSAFSGAVDDLRINNTVYDFEPNGVNARPAP